VGHPARVLAELARSLVSKGARPGAPGFAPPGFAPSGFALPSLRAGNFAQDDNVSGAESGHPI